MSISLTPKVSLAANHCGTTNLPVDQDVLGSNPTSVIDWVLHPGTFAISQHGGEPCTFFQAVVPAGSYTVTAWHEVFGSKSVEVTVADGAATADFTYGLADLKRN